MDENRIEKRVELNAPISRVWRALTDYREFGEWFQVRLESPFVPGEISRGNISHPGYEHIRMEVMVQTMQPQHIFSFTWHPYAIDPKIDYSKEPSTLVEFRLDKDGTGTLSRLPNPVLTKFLPTAALKPSAKTKADGLNNWKT